MLLKRNAGHLANDGVEAFQHERISASEPSASAVPAHELPSAAVFDPDWLIAAWVDTLRDHSHLSNVLTHISGKNWKDVERALRSIFDGSARGRDLSPLAHNIVELLCADRGATGRIMKPYFRDFLASALPPDQARRLSAHVTALFLELEMQDPFGADDENAKKIAVVQGSSTASAQKLFQDIVERWSPQIRIAGALEERDRADGRTCRAGQLKNLGDSTRYSMFHESASSGTACDIEAAGLGEAADAVRRDIAAGCDAAILSKFGKLEASGGGLRTAFTACVEAKIPLLTYVPFKLSPAWESFAGFQTVFLAPETLVIDEWLRSFSSIRRAMTSF